MTSWAPPSTDDIGATVLVVATSTTNGLRVTPVMSQLPADVRVWLHSWIRAYLRRMGDGGTTDPDFTYVYVALGAIDGATPSGETDGEAVLQSGYGGPPIGPARPAPTTIAAMWDEVLRAVDEAT